MTKAMIRREHGRWSVYTRSDDFYWMFLGLGPLLSIGVLTPALFSSEGVGILSKASATTIGALFLATLMGFIWLNVVLWGLAAILQHGRSTG